MYTTIAHGYLPHIALANGNLIIAGAFMNLYDFLPG